MSVDRDLELALAEVVRLRHLLAAMVGVVSMDADLAAYALEIANVPRSDSALGQRAAFHEIVERELKPIREAATAAFASIDPRRGEN